ncbi:anti-sigma factor [Paenibacillus sp. CF384]|uniref:anti-sigma factor family protein n=1 Tax=Paenibacillus sp. CF384 TaxID=1884382 RepID=UPI0008949BC6|nr:zf-HC2 domain-containing protein [Paenibacillus sp. CF384]SDX28145.1 hypothetical protein SAMN05518855_1011141 [Paenibacillus sp. CF384]
MMHHDEAYWRRYAEDTLTVEERLEAEDHLADCSSCLELYMELLVGVEEIESLDSEAAEAVTGRIMAAIAAVEQVQTPPPPKVDIVRRSPVKRSSRKQTMIHYLIAVCVMLVLMSTGVFQRIAEQPQQWEEHQINKKESVSVSIMERTAAVIEAMVEKPNK